MIMTPTYAGYPYICKFGMSKLRISDFLKKPKGDENQPSTVFKVSSKVGKLIDNHTSDVSMTISEVSKSIDTNNPVLYHKQYIQGLDTQDKLDEYYLNIFDTLPKYINTSQQMHQSITTSIVESVNNDGLIHKIDTTPEIQLRNDYFRIVDPCKVEQSSLVIRTQTCPECDETIEVHNGLFTCKECGHVMEAIDYQYSYRDTVEAQVKTQFSYKKAARFIDLLRSLQAKDNSDIPRNIIEAVKKQIEMENEDFNVKKDLTIARVKDYLKRCRFNKYYDHAPSIIYRITGKAPLELSSEQEQLILSMFSEITDHYEMAKQRVNSSRSSFLSYNYVLYKCFEILDLKDEMEVVTILKSSEKIAAMDAIWKVIMSELSWPFYRTI